MGGIGPVSCLDFVTRLQIVPTNNPPTQVTAADFNGDGAQDLAATLHISKTANPDEVRLHWSTTYPDFDLQGSPNLNGPGPYPFVNVPTAPTVVNGDYSVTNSTVGRDGCYRLRKP